jgi:methylthioribose-1-phosphate isomerase
MKIETLRWVDGHLEMIDQRILPEVFKYISYHNATEVAEGIRSMVVRGAPAIGVAAAYGVALEALACSSQSSSVFSKSIQKSFDILGQSRPTAVNLFWAIDRMKNAWLKLDDSLQSDGKANKLLELAHEIYNEDILVNKRLGQHGSDLIGYNARVLTHCNAGALATAGYGTALGVIRAAAEAGKNVSVVADETRPFLQGARLTAWEMVQEDIPCTLIADNMAGHLMSTGEIDCVVVGTDRVAANGDVANKIGTYMVAVLAQRHNIPFYVACPVSTIDLEIESGAQIQIEEREPSEVTGFREKQWAALGVSVRNPAFDITPVELVSGLITEKGVVINPTREKLVKLTIDEQSF